MPPPLLSLQTITLTLGGKPLLDGADLAVGAGERVCLVGRNGSGKSTLLRIAAGLLAADTGTRFVQPGATLRYLPQEPDFGAHATVLDYAMAGLGPGDDAHRPLALLDALGIDPDADPQRLSGGEARRAALARTLAPAPDLLLLDEPTNHLDIGAIEWLEAELSGLGAGIVVISHDRRLLERLSRRTVWLDGGRTRQFDQGFARFEAWRDEVIEQEEQEHHKLGRQIAREEDWMRYGVTARRKRNMRRVGELADLRARFRAERGRADQAAMTASEAQGSGKLVAVLESVGKSYASRDVVRGLDLRLRRGDRLGIVGPNGAGKTTLLSLMTGTLAPDTGSVRLGTNLSLVTLDQLRGSLDAEATLADTLTGGGGDMVDIGGQKRHVIGYMKDFLFRPEQARTPVGRLSGGERGRLALAVALARPSNLMVLDEPTNDLDLETLDLLQDMLAAYAGTVLLVSHDRDFLDRVVTSTLAPEGDGRWIEYAGGYADMLAQRAGRSGDIGPRKSTERRGRPDAEPGLRPAAAKLTFRDRHALAHLPARMETLASSIASLRQRLEDGAFYQRDPAGFARATTALAAAEAELARAEEEWLVLEMRREALEG